MIGVTIVVSHLLYIPIILVAFFYPKRGVPFAVGISVIYLLMFVVVGLQNTSDLISAGARCIVFIIIAAVMSYLSYQLNEEQKQLKYVKDEWERTFDSVPDLIALIDLNHRILRINKATADRLKIPPEKIVGLRCYEVIHQSQSPPIICPHSRLLQDGKEHTVEVHEDNLGGDFLVTCSPLYDSQGKMIGSVHIARDITDRKAMEEEVENNNKELVRFNQALAQANKKLNILSSITRHDILNQITALLAYVQLSREIIKDPLVFGYNQKQIEIIQAIVRQIEFTRYYQDIGVRNPEWQDVKITSMRAAAQLPLDGISISLNFDGISIYADPLIEKVFYNLMENSIRHGEHVNAIIYSMKETQDGLTIVYEDNGIGIPPENKEKIFQRGFGNHTGLGLFLIREILSITGIHIIEAGEFGKGARFEIMVPKGVYRLSSTKTNTR